MSSSKPRLFNGVGLIFAGFLTLHLFGGVQTLKCDRARIDRTVACELTESGIFRQRITPIEAGQLQGATLDRKKANYRVVLLTKTDRIYFTSLHRVPFGQIVQQQRVDRIEGFLQNDTLNSLEIRQNNNWFAYPLGILFLIGGVWEVREYCQLRKLGRS